MTPENVSHKEPEKEVDVLYDFIYRDSSRIQSYYSQIFDGRLLSREAHINESQKRQKKGRISIASVVAGSVEDSDEVAESLKETVDPMEVITTDVISYFVEEGFTNDLQTAKNGQLVLVQGTVFFVDKNVMDMARGYMENKLKELQTAKYHKQDREQIGQMREATHVLRNLKFSGCYSLRTENGDIVAGTMKEHELEEPTETYYYRHGAGGLPGIYLLGIKEESLTEDYFGTDLWSASQNLANVMRDLVIPAKAPRVMPIAMFRSIER